MNQNSDGASRSVKVEPWIIEAQGDQEPSLSEHLVQLPGERWAMWRQVGLRGAGFPARLVLQLAVPECAATADRLMWIEAAAHQARDALADALTTALDARMRDLEQAAEEQRMREI